MLNALNVLESKANSCNSASNIFDTNDFSAASFLAEKVTFGFSVIRSNMALLFEL